MIRVAVVDDHPHVAIALRALLEETPDIQLVAESRRGVDVPALVRQKRPDVLLLDLFIEPEFDALSAVRSLRADFPDLKICLLSAWNAFGTADLEGADFRACANFGPLYK